MVLRELIDQQEGQTVKQVCNYNTDWQDDAVSGNKEHAMWVQNEGNKTGLGRSWKVCQGWCFLK